MQKKWSAPANRPAARNHCLIALLLLLAGSLSAQDITKGSIAGVVKDASGAIIADAKVHLESPFGARDTVTNSLGEYLFPNLVVGSGYSVRVEMPGFNVARQQDITVRVNQRATVDLTLELGSTTQTVEVVAGGVANIDLSSTTVGANISEDLYKNVAIGRNISSVISMAPGVADGIGTGAANPSINGASGLENLYVINGANVTDPGFGGFGTFSRTYGSLGNGVNFDFVQEVQVKSGGFEAQYGQALGGVVNVITRSGGNQLHGSAYGYFQPHRFEAERPDANLVTVNQRTRIVGAGNYDFGFDLGGYFKRDKFFWYGGFNPQFGHQYRSAPSVFKNSALGVVDVNTRTYNYQGKLNYNINERHQVEGAVFGDPSKTPTNFVRVSSLASDDNLRTSALDYGSRTWTARYNGTLTNTWLVSGNFSNYNNHFTETPQFQGYQITDNVAVQEGTGTQVIRNGLGFLESTETRAKQLSLMSTHTLTLFGGHTIDYGYQYENVPYDDIRLYSGAPFQLPNLPIFKDAAGQTTYGAQLIRTHADPKNLSSPIVLQLTRGNYNDPSIKTLTTYHAAFIQDSWNIGRRLTIRPGVRWEEQRMEGVASHYTFTGNWAPRIGVIFDPTGSRKSKFFANFGKFFEKVPSDISVRAFSFEAGVRGVFYKDSGLTGTPDLSPANYVGGSIPGQKLSFSGGPSNLTFVQPGAKSQYQNEVVAGYEREFNKGWTFSSRFVYRYMRRIIEDISPINVTQALAGVGQTYVIANPDANFDISVNGVPCSSGPTCDLSSGFNANAGVLTPDGQPDGFPNPVRTYKSAEFVLSRRMTNWQFFGSYRLAKLFGNFEGSFRNDNGQQDPNISSLFDFTNSDGILGDQFKPGVLPSDRRHQFKLFANHQFTETRILKNLNAGLSWNIQSGTPISKLLAHPAYDSPGEIPVGGRGALGRTDWTAPLDLHLDYTIKTSEKTSLKLICDLFNISNQKTLIRVDQYFELDSTTKNPDFLKPWTSNTTFAYPYQVPFHARMAVRFTF